MDHGQVWWVRHELRRLSHHYDDADIDAKFQLACEDLDAWLDLMVADNPPASPRDIRQAGWEAIASVQQVAFSVDEQDTTAALALLPLLRAQMES